MISTELKFKLKDNLNTTKNILFLVGAGLSAESGIPTFRGFDGFWTVGSENYTPQEMGTFEMFQKQPDEVWKWYLHRIKTCQKAQPNIGHQTLAKFEKLLGNRFKLISQNVDGLHHQVGNFDKNLFLIHGDLRYMRCAKNCTNKLFEIPTEVIENESINKLICPTCQQRTRPHVLWFDESYNEVWYHQNTVIDLAENCSVLFIIGTSGATLLPRAIADLVRKKQGLIINIDPFENRFTPSMKQYKNGFVIQQKSGLVLPVFYEFAANEIISG